MSDITIQLQLPEAMLERIERDGDHISLHFSKVFLVQEMEGAFEDSLWTQAVNITVSHCETGGELPACPCELDGGDFIEATLASVLNQTFTDFEVVVSDDASTDGTIPAVESVEDPRLTISGDRSHVGPGGNWNRAVALARGEYVKVLAQDDVLYPNNLEVSVGVLDADIYGPSQPHMMGLVGQQPRRRGQHVNALEQVVGDHGQHYVELKIARLARQGNGRIIADDLRRNHGDGLRDDRVDLARHDARARLQRRQRNLGKPRERAGVHPAQVVGDLHQYRGQHFHLPMNLERGFLGADARGQVPAWTQGQPRLRGQDLRHCVGKIPVAIEAGPYCGATKGQLRESRQ